MGKIKVTAGIPVFVQLLSLISRKDFQRALEVTKADFAVKKLKTWDLMVSMIFAAYQRTSGLRELSSGLAGYSEGEHWEYSRKCVITFFSGAGCSGGLRPTEHPAPLALTVPHERSVRGSGFVMRGRYRANCGSSFSSSFGCGPMSNIAASPKRFRL